MLVDSCLVPGTSEPASRAYLEQIGVPASGVKAIIASHWHDDHVRGISTLAAHYADAEFMLSHVFSDAEATAFLAAYSEKFAPGLSRGSKELYSAVKAREIVYFLHQRTSVLELTANERNIRVCALSPTPAACAQSIAHFASHVPKNPGIQIGHAPEMKPNLEAVVLHIDFVGDAVLLGSDLENHEALGWSAVVNDQWCANRPRSSAYKVAHHGSSTGDHPPVWANMLNPNPVTCLTPYSLAGQYLPTSGDKSRIRDCTPHAYISSGASRRPSMDAAVLKRLNDIATEVTVANPGFGAVRLRKVVGAQEWTREFFGAAGDL
ncbi:MAG: hypothetical protein H6R10_2779 [Rhodocyclaceae bacterium]|nr:hypothetical protein [Rhodocyclaceae bacterium]